MGLPYIQSPPDTNIIYALQSHAVSITICHILCCVVILDDSGKAPRVLIKRHEEIMWFDIMINQKDHDWVTMKNKSIEIMEQNPAKCKYS